MKNGINRDAGNRALVAITLSDQEKLEALRSLDQFRRWHSLDDQRYCLSCGKLFAGREIQVLGDSHGDGPLRLICPTEGCQSIAMDWVLPTDEILAQIKMAPSEPVGAIASRHQSDSPKTSIAASLRKLATQFKRSA
jgi:hypothetical protein